MQFIRESEKDMDKNNTGYNEIIIKEKTPYEFVVPPEEKIVLQFHPEERVFFVHLFSTLSFDVCMTTNI